MTAHKPSLPYLTPENADARARVVLEDALAQVGFIPNMYAAMVNSPGVLETYLKGYSLFRKESGFSSQEQEIIFLVISRESACHYCMAAHSMLAEKMSGVSAEDLRAVRAGAAPPGPRLGALANFVQVMVRSRGLPAREDVAAFLSAGFTERQVLEIILAIAVKTLSNYTNHFFQTPVDEMFTGHAWVPGTGTPG